MSNECKPRCYAIWRTSPFEAVNGKKGNLGAKEKERRNWIFQYYFTQTHLVPVTVSASSTASAATNDLVFVKYLYNKYIK